jgi:hypothetical protein
MKFQGAIVTEQGVTFAIVVVRRSAIQPASQADKVREAYRNKIREAYRNKIREFQSPPLILAAQNASGAFRFQGRRDIVSYLDSLRDPLHQIPWREYTTT